MTGCIQNCG